MSLLFKKHLSRRTFIRGVGVTMSLPFLDAMVPARTALAQTAARRQVRLGLCFIPHGAVMNQWTPATTGALELSPILSPLAGHKDQVVVLSNLAHAQAGPQGPGDNGGDHTRCPAVFLNGVHPKRTDGADIQAGTTIDQMAAAQIGQDTLLPSLELAVEDYSGLVGSCDVGFSCTYMNTISWRTPTSPLPVLIAGGAAGKLKGGRHLSYPAGTPMSNLLLTILDKAGVRQETVGDSTGLLTDV